MERCEVVEAFETGSIVVGNEANEEGIAVGVRDEEAVGAATLGLLADGLDDTPVEALDEAVGLGPIGPCEAVVDALLGTAPIEGVTA